MDTLEYKVTKTEDSALDIFRHQQICGKSFAFLKKSSLSSSDRLLRKNYLTWLSKR